jgi:quercetin dioxygenase-like cupin family protein
MMTRTEFEAMLASEGVSTVVEVVREANGGLDLHSHPFEARALILEGEITVVVNGETIHCGPGEQFHLAANTPHTEHYGPQGVRYVAGRS